MMFGDWLFIIGVLVIACLPFVKRGKAWRARHDIHAYKRRDW